MAKRLIYFDINGLAESIRYLLHYARVEFEDVRYSSHSEEWRSEKANYPFGGLPVYEEDGRRLHQSLAIARYLGHAHGLAAGEPWQDAQLDALALTINDFNLKMGESVRTQGDVDKKAAARKTFLDETVVYYFSRFEKQLKENNGFFVGKMSWVEFVLVGAIDMVNMFHKVSVEDKYPSVKALVAKIHSSPGVKSYVSTRKPYKNPFDK